MIMGIAKLGRVCPHDRRDAGAPERGEPNGPSRIRLTTLRVIRDGPCFPGTDQVYFFSLARSSRASFKCSLPAVIEFFA
jgi:hypothetical protein